MPPHAYTKSKREDNIGIAPMKSKGHLVTDSVGRAELLVDQFQTFFTKEDNQSLPNILWRVKEDILTLNIGEEGVRKLLQNIKINNVAGPDEFPNRVLQECSNEAAPAITAIFQQSIDSGESQKTGEKLTLHQYLK